MRTSLPSRILMTADTVGGVWHYALELIRAFEPHGIEVLLATMGAPVAEAQRRELDALPNVELAESRFKLEWMDDPWCDVEAAGEWLLGLEEYFQPEVVHLNGYAHGALPWRSPKVVVGHSCVLSWWKAVKGEDAPAPWNGYRRAVIRGLRGADAVVTPTRAMLDCLGEQYGPLPHGRVIPNGRSFDCFPAGAKEDFILSAGRLWDEAKNVRAVCACSVPWPVWVAGETRHPGGSAQAAHLQNVLSLGKLESSEMSRWFNRASVYALPARYEPFGLSILEAALSECALVLGDIPSLRENWEGAAMFVSPDDLPALESALHELIANPERRRDLQKRAGRRARNFDIGKTAEQYVKLYGLLVDRKDSTMARKESCVTV